MNEVRTLHLVHVLTYQLVGLHVSTFITTKHSDTNMVSQSLLLNLGSLVLNLNFSESQNCINYYTHLPLQGVGHRADVETKLTPPVSHCETKHTPPVSHCETKLTPPVLHCETKLKPPVLHCETKLTPPVSHYAAVEAKLTLPVPHNNNHTVEPRNTSQEDQLHFGVPTRNIYNTLENDALEVSENE